ncbi:ABC transporter ATP-binding protein [Frankia sp. AgKG'84/4]|nr:ABC transporter ATP-binding protein [Frankia sp. AgKG'84/4]
MLDVRDLRVTFPTHRSRLHAVRGVDLTLAAGECLAIVGESGSGKSVTVRSLLGLAGRRARVEAERLELGGEDLLSVPARRLRQLRGGTIGLVLQDALVSLDPLRPVQAEIAEALRNHRVVPSRDVPGRVIDLLEQAGVPEPAVRARQYPRELSGGLRQRALIASAMAAAPPVLVADEPTTALDVTIQARVLASLASRKAAGTALLLVSHDLAVVAGIADRVAVMYQGLIVEEGPATELLTRPAHPYTRLLIAAVPSAHNRGRSLAPPAAAAGGTVRPTEGCVFAPRCPLVTDRCIEQQPPTAPVGPDRTARCWYAEPAAPAPPAALVQAGPVEVSAARAPDSPAAPAPAAVAPTPVLTARGLSKSFPGPDGSARQAVDDVSFELRPAEILGLVGESGSGKTTVANLVLALLTPDSGEVLLGGEAWSQQPEPKRRPLRHRLQLVPQDPLGSFDPRYTVARIVGEAVPDRSDQRRRRVAALLDRVGLSAGLLDRRPAQLSGGERQRVAVARALAPEPDVLVCDEPVSALDVSVQGQILDLFDGLRRDLGTAMLFVSHDLAVIQHLSDRVMVMQAGRVVEAGNAVEVFEHPGHPYTQDLLAALPRLHRADIVAVGESDTQNGATGHEGTMK